jgi:glycosyltransferase involved in cell wall biosynthesis
MTNTDHPTPIVSVAMITYNHEQFIAQAIESVLMQQTSFFFELVIGEDCSTDTTREIVQSYARENPARIRLLLPEQNTGMIPNFVNTLRACRGRYIALCEGDDYWTDPHKLQKQVDLLDDQPEYALCFHRVTMFQEDDSQPVKYKPATQRKEISDLEDLLQGNFIHSCSVMFRRSAIDQFPDWYYEIPFPDWPLFVFCAQQGQIYYITEVMGAHRLHESGSWTTRPQIEKLKSIVTLYQHFHDYLPEQYQDLINTQMYKHSLVLAKKCIRQGDMVCAQTYWQACLKLAPVSFVTQWKQFIWLTTQIYTPQIYQAYKRVAG